MGKSISIITPLHNKGPYVAETLRSIQAQTIADWEMLVVENHSSDDGPAQVEAMAAEDSRIRLLRAPESVRGPGAARNLGLEHASGEWILFLDADDLIESGYLEARLSAAGLNADIVAGPWQEFYDAKPDQRTTLYPDGWTDRRAPLDTAFCFTPWVLHAAMIRTAHCRSTGGWAPRLDKLPSEDCHFWFTQLDNARIFWSDHAGCVYRKGLAGSRDDHQDNHERIFKAAQANRQANVEYLARTNRRPSPQQAATAVRVARNLHDKNISQELKAQTTDEIRYWLALTDPFDLRMLYLRFCFGVFSCPQKERKSVL